MLSYLNAGDRYGSIFTAESKFGRINDDALDLGKKDIERLRILAQKKHEYANSEVMQKRKVIWTNTNDLKMTRPPVFINEICWNEMNQGDLDLLCEHPFAKDLELDLLRELYMVEHNLGDEIIEDFIECPMYVYDSGFGIDEIVDIRETDTTSDVVSRHFHILIQDMSDVGKIKMPKIQYDEERTKQYFEKMQEIFSDIIPVKIVGSRGLWFTPWDFLIRVMGVEETLINLYDEPDFIEAVVKRYVDCSMERMKKYRELGVWASNNTSNRVGSGGYGLTSDLASPEGKDTHCDTVQMWGCGNAQIFSDVSEEMHWQFSLQYELDWLKQFGLNYYGCCEPLFRKMDIMAKIPNLRKISMSPWNDFNAAAALCKNNYVMSCKPNPAIFVGNNFNEEIVKKDIKDILIATKGCNIELVMKDISTVNYNPQNLWKWAELARLTIDEMYGSM